MGKVPYRSWDAYFDVYHKDDYRCVYCGRDMLVDFDSWMSIEIDHVVPASKGGADSIENLVTACSVCNKLKSRFVVEGFESKIVPEVLEAARVHVLKKRAEWQAKFAPAVEKFNNERLSRKLKNEV
jgi:CRISPR/Cas system Type II protein with McrA/HNH and RuvC-like nuclease domain